MSRGRLDGERTVHDSVLEYFELRELGNNHAAACARLGLSEKTLADRYHLCIRKGNAVPPKPEGLTFADDWPYYKIGA